jgi:hypothetical protein
MTRPTVMEKDRLAAFVDGELSPEEAAAVVIHLADHPQDQVYVDDLTAANVALSQAFAAEVDEPVPDRLRHLIMGKKTAALVLPFGLRAAVRPVTALLGGLALGATLAASLTVAVFLPAIDPYDLSPGPLSADFPLIPALASLPSGTAQVLEDEAEVMILATLPTPTGFCREIEVVYPRNGRLEAALVCTEGSGWTVEVVLTENYADAAATEGFGTASGNEGQSFTPFLDRIGAGPVLSPAEEAAAITRGWAK